jgi:hypothetical protein
MLEQSLTISQISEGLDDHAAGQRVLPPRRADIVPGNRRHPAQPTNPACILLRVQA